MSKLGKTIFKKLYVQVLIGILLGVILGILSPEWAVVFKPCSDAFIKLIKMLIAPIIFLTLVSGIAAMHDMREVGKIGGSALVYFILMTTVALVLGLVVANFCHPGSGLNITQSSLDNAAAQQYLSGEMPATSVSGFLLHVIPDSFLSPFVSGSILQVLFISILFSVGMILLGEQAKPILVGIQVLSKIFFQLIHVIMYLAPIAAFAAMAYSIGKYGSSSLLNMVGLLACYFFTCLFFIVVILGLMLQGYCKISLLKLLRYIRTEILIALGTSSSETVLPNLMEKLELLGCKKSVVGLVLPMGYSFNLAGTAIYLTLGALFISQALNIDLTLGQELSLLGLMIISSKGAAGVAGSGFFILASSLAAFGHIPVAGIILILGIERFMSDGRTVTNIIGNAIATVIVSTWEGTFDLAQAQFVLNNQSNREI